MPTTSSGVRAPGVTPGEIAELERLLARHSTLQPPEEKALVSALRSVRSAGPSVSYDVYVRPDRNGDALQLIERIPDFRRLDKATREEVAGLYADLQGRFMAWVQENKPARWTLGFYRPLKQHAYETVARWNEIVDQRPALAEYRLKFGKGTEGLTIDELKALIGRP